MEREISKKGYIDRVIALSLSLTKVNFFLRNEGSYFGILWYLLNPLALFYVIFFVEGNVFTGHHTDYYAIYLLVGILLINIFSGTVSSAIGTISANGSFIKSIKIPEESLVVSRVMQTIVSHFFEMLIILACLIYYHLNIFAIFGYFLVVLELAVFTLGISFIFATIGVYVSDFGNVWSVLSGLLFFVTPTFYVPTPGSALAFGSLFNPLYYYLLIARAMLIGDSNPPLWMFAVMTAMSITSLLIGIYYFRKKKNKFAEQV